MVNMDLCGDLFLHRSFLRLFRRLRSKIAVSLYDKADKLNDSDLSPDIQYVNKINTGRISNRLQTKIYQKTFGLCRIEFTIYSGDAGTLFDPYRTDREISLDQVGFVHYNLKVQDILVERFDRSLDDVVRFVSMKESEDLIYSLKDLDVFEAYESNRVIRQRLTRKGILQKMLDSDGKQKRGLYIVNPVIREFLNLYSPKGNEHFVKNELYPWL